MDNAHHTKVRVQYEKPAKVTAVVRVSAGATDVFLQPPRHTSPNKTDAGSVRARAYHEGFAAAEK